MRSDAPTAQGVIEVDEDFARLGKLFEKTADTLEDTLKKPEQKPPGVGEGTREKNVDELRVQLQGMEKRARQKKRGQ